MKVWKITPGIVILMVSLFLIGPAMGQVEPPEEEDEGGIFDLLPDMDPEDMEMKMEIEFDDIDHAVFTMSVELELGIFLGVMKGYLDSDHDGEVEEEEIADLEGLFDGEDMEDGFLGLTILIDNKTAQMTFDSGWTGLLGDVNDTGPIGMFATIDYSWDVEESGSHTIILRPIDEDDEYEEWEDEYEDENNTIEYEDEANESGLDLPVSFTISLPDGWSVDIDSVIPTFMAEFVTDDGDSIVLTSQDIQDLGDPEGDIVSFQLVKGDTEDSPLPLWLPVGALLIGALSVGLLRRRRH
jgi:hypothetical protein